MLRVLHRSARPAQAAAMAASSARAAFLAPVSALSAAPRCALTAFASAFGRAAAPARAYHERVIDHYENPRNVGSLPKSDPNVGTGLVGAPACGDVMKLQVKVDAETGVITQAVFKTFGCGSAIASSSLATSWAEGQHIDEVVKIKNTDIARHLSLPPVKLHCSMLAEDAIKAAVADYKSKQGAGKTATATATATAGATQSAMA